MINGRFSVFLIFLLFTNLAHAEANPIKVQEVNSPGGIKAWLVQDDKLPLIAMSFAFRGGVEQDPEDKQGLAELATSLVMQGAGPYTAEGFQQKLADNSIQLNFSAGRDAVQGSLKTLRDTRREAFHLLKTALTKPRFDVEDFERTRSQQMTAVQTMLGDAGWQGRRALFAALFHDHPYAYRRFGNLSSLASLTREDVRQFAAGHFARDNLLVAVTGAISATELARTLDEVFGQLPRKANLAEIADITVYPEPATIVVEREGTQTDMFFALPMLRRQDPDWFAAEIVNYALGGGGFSSRLMNVVRDQEGLTYGINTSLAPMDKASLLMGHASTDNAKTGLAWKKVAEVWRHLYLNGLADAEIVAAKDYLTGALPLALTTTNAIADVLLNMQLQGLDKDYLGHRNDMIRRVNADDIRRVIFKWYNFDRLTVVMVGKPEGVAPTETLQQVRQ